MFSRPSFFAVVAPAMLGALVAFSPATAHATVLSDCGNIDLSGNESCSFMTSGGCTSQCTPVNVDVSCAGQLETMCGGTCNGTIDTSCTSTCTSSCTATCMANPGSFSCSGSCEADCSGHCQSQCSSDANQDECTASCKETCGANCNTHCTSTAPSADCTDQCTASCTGSCQAQANFTCDISCQEMGYASCQSMVTGGCMTQCQQPQGALFCNGQFVNVDTSQLAACEEQLASELSINVNVSASATGSASCGQIAPGAPVAGSVFAVGLGLGIAGAVRRRARKSKKA
jgi:hypothetical protein